MEQTQACQNYAEIVLRDAEGKRAPMTDDLPFSGVAIEANYPLQLRPSGETKRSSQMSNSMFLFSSTAGSATHAGLRSHKQLKVRRTSYRATATTRQRKDPTAFWKKA